MGCSESKSRAVAPDDARLEEGTDAATRPTTTSMHQGVEEATESKSNAVAPDDARASPPGPPWLS